MNGKQAKRARKMVADALPARAVSDIPGRMSRGRIMRALTKYENHDNGSKSINGKLYKLRPSVVLQPDSPRQIYQKVTKPWMKTKTAYVS